MNYHDFLVLAGQIIAIVLGIGIGYIVLQEAYIFLAGLLTRCNTHVAHPELSALAAEPQPVKRGPGRPRKHA